ncbi:GlxA family transcriptional regulator [Brucella anthropi]|uniref:GlxA family transcriptional regulator n=1 Tax=Brucella anthropi TaxID=529 RepID=UPI001AEBB0A2|nr:helix-turn-helix domain-containing protein [Brucella anthropi]
MQLLRLVSIDMKVAHRTISANIGPNGRWNPLMHTVAVLAYDGISPFHLSVPGIVFGDDLLKLGIPRYNLQVCAERIGPIRTLSGFDIDVRHDLSVVEQADTVIIPSWGAPDDIPQKTLIDALVKAKARGARIVGLCLGTFVLAYAGLLEKRTVSTHWAWADDFQKAYPDVHLDRDALYSDEGDIITSAGTAAAIDCCLYILRKDQGAEIANRVARRLVVAPYRHGGQSQYIEMPIPDISRTNSLSKAMDWALAHLNETITVDVLANRANMSRRSFTRHFRQKTGTTLVQWLLNQRLSVAQRLLETGDCSVENIASMAGFGSTVSFRLQFVKTFTVSPAIYRRHFRSRNIRL